MRVWDCDEGRGRASCSDRPLPRLLDDTNAPPLGFQLLSTFTLFFLALVSTLGSGQGVSRNAQTPLPLPAPPLPRFSVRPCLRRSLEGKIPAIPPGERSMVRLLMSPIPSQPASDFEPPASTTYTAPGRFHAHPRPNANNRAGSGLMAGPRQYKRGVTRRPFLSGEEEEDNERSSLLRPDRERVEGWLEAWWKRWAVLVGIPCLVVRISGLCRSLGTAGRPKELTCSLARSGCGSPFPFPCRIHTSRSPRGTFRGPETRPPLYLRPHGGPDPLRSRARFPSPQGRSRQRRQRSTGKQRHFNVAGSYSWKFYLSLYEPHHKKLLP